MMTDEVAKSLLVSPRKSEEIEKILMNWIASEGKFTLQILLRSLQEYTVSMYNLEHIGAGAKNEKYR